MKVVLWIAGLAASFVVFLVVLGLGTETPERDALQNAKRAVEEQLKDGSSADFRHLKVVKDQKGRLTVCGEVNARNSFGAMAGFRRFVFFGASPAIIEEAAATEIMDGFWSEGGCDSPPLYEQD